MHSCFGKSKINFCVEIFSANAWELCSSLVIISSSLLFCHRALLEEECRPLQAWQLHWAATLILCGSQIITENDGGFRGLRAGPKGKALTLWLWHYSNYKEYGNTRAQICCDCKIKTRVHIQKNIKKRDSTRDGKSTVCSGPSRLDNDTWVRFE